MGTRTRDGPGPVDGQNGQVNPPAGPPIAEHFLGALSPEQAGELWTIGARRRFPAGSVLFLEGDPPLEVLVVLSGELKVAVGSEDGRDLVLDVFGPGKLVGELSVIDGRPRSASITSLTTVEVLTVASGPFNEFLDRNPVLLRWLLVDIVDRLRTRVRHQLELGAGDALGRVCARLAELAERYGEPDGTAVRLQCPVSQADLAGWTGLSREAVVKVLRTLRQLGWVENQGPAITIRDLPRLRGRAIR